MVVILTGANCLLAQDPCGSPALEQARNFIMNRQFEEAVKILEPFDDAHHACAPDQYHMLALAQMNLHKGEQALDTAARGMLVFPDSTLLQQYFVSLAAFAASNGEAVERLRSASDKAPGSRILAEALCKALLKVNPESEEAGSRLRTLLASQPEDVESRFLYAEWLCSVNRPREALVEIRMARRLPAPNSHFEVRSYLLEAAAQDQSGNAGAARVAYQKAIELNAKRAKPDTAPEWNFAKFLIQNGEGREAKPVLQSLLSRSPSFVLARLAMAEILSASGDFPAAIEQATVALQDSTNADDQRRAHILLSRVYHLAGNEDSARVHAGWVEHN